MKNTAATFAAAKAKGEKLSMLTAYDYSTAKLEDESGINGILVGDSLGNVVLGYEDTVSVTMEDMIHHGAAVARGAKNALVVVDMPFMSYQVSIEEALRNAGRAVKEAGANAVKLEGGAELVPLISRLVDCGIPVMPHLGLLPQRIQTAGTYRITGRTDAEVEKLLSDARAVEAAGAFALVLECMPAEVGRRISEALTIPTIGIGSGIHCDGQVQVLYDVLGLFEEFTPKHSRRYAELGRLTREALKNYADDVRNGAFPGPENSF